MSVACAGASPRCRSISKRAASLRRKAARCVPQTAKRGFADGRVRGRQFAEHDVAYVSGAVVGFVCGAAEAAMEALARPVNWWLFGDAEPA